MLNASNIIKRKHPAFGASCVNSWKSDVGSDGMSQTPPPGGSATLAFRMRIIWSLEVQVSATLYWMIIVRERKRKELINYSRNSLPIILRKRKAVATVHIACIRDSGVGVEISASLFPETKVAEPWERYSQTLEPDRGFRGGENRNAAHVETGRSVLKFQNALKNAMQMTHMLDGMLSVSVCQQFFEMVLMMASRTGSVRASMFSSLIFL
ncbi:hypothetical protein Peur_019811 [Populus x canadensis]